MDQSKFNIQKKEAPKPTVTDHVTLINFKPSDTNLLKEDTKVELPKFGYGEVVSVDVNGSERKAKIMFEKVGEKTLLLSFIKLMIC
jgi:DNA helicase II / ATP-dependent DNA helicase PcrA